jgi:hypothetical protein
MLPASAVDRSTTTPMVEAPIALRRPRDMEQLPAGEVGREAAG